MQNKNFIVMCACLGAAALLSVLLYFKDVSAHDEVDIKQFPTAIGNWTSREIPIPKKDLAILETENAFVRKYSDPDGQQVYLYIIYSKINRKVSHPPEICYTGGGITILENVHDPIPVAHKGMTIQTNRLMLKGKNFHQVSYYWFKVGDEFTSNYWKQQALVAWNALLGKQTGAALIRVSADIGPQSKEFAIKSVKEFTDLIAPHLFTYLH